MQFLIKKFIKNYENTQDVVVRRRYGNLGSIVGIIMNLFLFLGKLMIGVISSSISITSDAINNLSDAGSCIITIISFKLSSRPPDDEHPYGHARIEYISSLVVAGIILLLGLEMFKSSINKIFNPTPILFNGVVAIVLIVSIVTKLWMYKFNTVLGKKIDSGVMIATATDSLSDVMATSAVLLSAIISYVFNINLDGYMGLAVSILIFKAGLDISKDALDQLLGGKPNAKFIKQIQDFIFQYDGVLGMHDLLVHDYGPSHSFASVHVEVSSNVDVMTSHDVIDNIERDFLEKCGTHLVIHMDPIVVDNPLISEVKNEVVAIAASIYEGLTVHDFRMVIGDTHSNLIFDVVVPYKCAYSFETLEEKFTSEIHKINSTYNTVAVFERNYVL